MHNGAGFSDGKPLCKRPLGRPRRRRENSIKMDLGEICYEDSRWIEEAQNHIKWRGFNSAILKLRGVLPVFVRQSAG
jgi:hypothetical protein